MFAAIAFLGAAGRTARAQDPSDTTRKITPTPPVTPPSGTPGTPALRMRLGRDTLPLSRLSDSGRRAFSMSADTDVAENISSSFVISRVESFDRNLNRNFTQTVLSAVMHLQFYAGEFK
ncbi:MAG TPA: hypothetical protein VN876_00875 [Gemmatimonadaceae bacterium]|nr:hypothetical protein [Gemmatimonadaceae bacterium]